MDKVKIYAKTIDIIKPIYNFKAKEGVRTATSK